MTILVTGGLGFIGSNFVKHHVMNYEENVVILDNMTYAANPNAFDDLPENRRKLCSNWYIGDIGNRDFVAEIFDKHNPRAVINFAAESHVDRSITGADPFIQTNIVGTYNLIEICRSYNEYCNYKGTGFRFIHISTDEVYGSLISTDEPSHEGSPYAPRSPYAASKAASDHLVMAAWHTHRFPAIITNCSNNYGPLQHPEKFIPTVILNALQDKPVPVYGTGKNIRDWLYVEDHCSAIELVLAGGKLGEKYNIGGGIQLDNLSLAQWILDLVGKPRSLIQFVEDRKGHDFRYDINHSKISRRLGWYPTTNLENGLVKTIEWYTHEYAWNNSGSGKVEQTVPGNDGNNEATASDLR